MRPLLLLLCLLCCSARAEKPWVFEFEFAQGLHGYTDRLLMPDCGKVVPTKFVEWYARSPDPGWSISCGNDQPMYMHFLGRQCWNPLPNLVMECGWRHFSSPGDNHEISFDALSVRGRFRF